MSKKTRKKSSKPSPKSRKAPARKPSAAKTASKTASRGATTAAKKPAAKVASKAAKPAAKTAKTAPAKASHKPTSKQLIKSNLSAPPKAAAGTGLVEGAMAPPFSLPRDGGGSVSLADYAGKKLVLFSIRGPTRRAAPGRQSTSRGSTTRLPTKGPRCSASRPTP